jgi:hypothetical protein
MSEKTDRCPQCGHARHHDVRGLGGICIGCPCTYTGDPAPREATEEELRAQRAGYVRAEMAFGTDRQEAEEREATEEALQRIPIIAEPGPEKPEPTLESLQKELVVARGDLQDDFRWLQEISSALSSSRTRPDDLQSMLDEIYHLHCDLRELHNVNRIVSGLRSKGEACPAAITALKEIVELARLADDISVCNDIAEIAEKAIAESPTGQPLVSETLDLAMRWLRSNPLSPGCVANAISMIKLAQNTLAKGAVAQTATPPEEKRR